MNLAHPLFPLRRSSQDQRRSCCMCEGLRRVTSEKGWKLLFCASQRPLDSTQPASTRTAYSGPWDQLWRTAAASPFYRMLRRLRTSAWPEAHGDPRPVQTLLAV